MEEVLAEPTAGQGRAGLGRHQSQWAQWTPGLVGLVPKQGIHQGQWAQCQSRHDKVWSLEGGSDTVGLG